MARYEYDEDAIKFYRAATHTPGRITINLKLFVTLCILSMVGCATLLMIMVGV